MLLLLASLALYDQKSSFIGSVDLTFMLHDCIMKSDIGLRTYITRLGKRESYFFLLSFTCNYVVSVRWDFFFLLVFGMGYVISLWLSLGLPYNHYVQNLLPQECNFVHTDSECTCHYQHDGCLG